MMAKAPTPEKEQPEQLVHGVKNITTANVGTVIDTGPATITQILYTGAPTNYEVATFNPSGMPLTAYFTLVDDATNHVIYSKNFHTGGGFSPHATHKASGYTISYTGNLVLQSCPAGATFSLTTA
jgi:hypothetical protein